MEKIMKASRLFVFIKSMASVFASLVLFSTVLTGCDPLDFVHHYSAHIGGYIGKTDLTSATIAGLDGYTNVSTQFPEGSDEYQYFVKRYIFEKWDGNGPSGKVQFWRETKKSSDWIDEKIPGEDGYVPFTKDLCYENGGVYLDGYSWQQPWKSFSWKVYRANSDEMILVSEKSSYFFRIVKGEKIEPAAGKDESSREHDRERGMF